MLDRADLEQDFRSQGDTVLEKLTEWVEVKGDRLCLYYGEQDQAYTFQRFNQICNRVANGLAGLGVKKGDRVSVLSKNAFVTTVTMFAAWKLGALYCPINNNYKGDLLAYIINDTSPKVLLADWQFIASLNAIKDAIGQHPQLLIHQPEPEAHDYDPTVTIAPDEDFSVSWMSALLESSEEDPDVNVKDTDLANIIYTSGTTGNPKGVVQNHKWIHNYNYYGLKLAHPDNVIYNDLPLYHVGGALMNVAGAVWAGSCLALWDRFSSEDFWRRIRKSGATHALLVDTMINWLMDAPPSAEDRNHSLKAVNMTPLPSNHNEVARRFGIAFVNCGYGSTELGVGFVGMIDELGEEYPKPAKWERGYTRKQVRALHAQMASTESLISGLSPVKKGFMGTLAPLVEVKVVDDADNKVAPGTPGQVAFRHKLPDMMFREYFNKPIETQSAMREGWFYASDVISYDEEGIYYFEDRKQGFIRVRGENVSATTVEQQIQDHPAISRCAVVGVPAKQGDEQDIAAFLVLKQAGDITVDEIDYWLRENLPKFMRPKYLRIVDALPITPTFKVEKYKLEQLLIAELSNGVLA